MPESPQSPPPRPSKRPRHHQLPAPVLPEDVILEQILTRVPAADVFRFRAVCRAWRAALTSDHFVRAHRAVRAGSGDQPEIVFFVPRLAAGGGSATAFYTCKPKVTSLQQDDAAAGARELLTVDDLRVSDLVLSGTRACRGLTLLSQPGSSAYHVCNLSTGEHIALPPCLWARRVLSYGPFVLSSTGIGFDAAAGEHKVVRLYDDWNWQQRYEVYGLRSGGWLPCAGHAPPDVAKGLDGRPPVFLDLDGCFYWHINPATNFPGADETRFGAPEPILSFSLATEQFVWVRPPEERKRYSFHLAELDGSLCVVVRTVGDYELWTRPAGSGGSPPPSWSLRCRLSLASLRGYLSYGARMLLLASSFGGKILLATSCHEVFSYDPRSNGVETGKDILRARFCGRPSKARAAAPHCPARGERHRSWTTSHSPRREPAEDKDWQQHSCEARSTCISPPPKRLPFCTYTAVDPNVYRRGSGAVQHHRWNE